mgnify:FL=1
MLNVLSLFSGIGAFEKALERERVLFRVMNFCEIDKYASKSYCAIHGVSEQINLRDVSTVNTAELHDVNLITYGFPCQDISTAGHQKGFFDENGNVTRSGLFFAALKIIKDTKPEYAIAENVKALTSKKFTAEFATVLDSLEQAGYNNYYKVLNAKDFGVPQNRERVFIVSIRKDVDFKFTFPVGEPLKLRMADLLENEVDPKFYLSDEQIKRIKTSSYCQNQRRIQSKEWCDTLCSRDWKDPKCVKVKQVFNIVDNSNGFTNPQRGRVYDTDGLSPCLSTMQGGGQKPKIVCEQRSDEGLRFFKDNVCGAIRTGNLCGDKRVLETENIAILCTKRTEYGKQIRKEYEEKKIKEKRSNMTCLIPRTDNITNTLTTVLKDNYLLTAKDTAFRIRKLTPLECWRLMGFDDEDFYKAQNAGISNSQLYKQAGNSIVVNVLQAIFRQFNFEKMA